MTHWSYLHVAISAAELLLDLGLWVTRSRNWRFAKCNCSGIWGGARYRLGAPQLCPSSSIPVTTARHISVHENSNRTISCAATMFTAAHIPDSALLCIGSRDPYAYYRDRADAEREDKHKNASPKNTLTHTAFSLLCFRTVKERDSSIRSMPSRRCVSASRTSWMKWLPLAKGSRSEWCWLRVPALCGAACPCLSERVKCQVLFGRGHSFWVVCCSVSSLFVSASLRFYESSDNFLPEI